MFCDEALDAIEAIAAGEMTPGLRVAQHLASCPNCAAAMESAREVERLLRARERPRPPSSFTSRTMARVRRARWRSEQFLDAGFNVALTLVVAGIVGVIWIAANRTGVSAVGSDALDLFSEGVVQLVHSITPALPLYAAATALVVSALGIWWWAENQNS